jgi:hypothetical protein
VCPLQEEGWVVCKAFKKKTNFQTKTNARWNPSNYLYDEQTSGIISKVDPFHDLTLSQPQRIPPQNFMYKQEIEEDSILSFMHSEHLLPLPQLESPSMAKRQNTMSIISENNINNNDFQNGLLYNINKTEKVTDWRAFDKFVASQLSQEDHRHDTSSDMSLLLLQSSRDEENKLSSFLSTSLDCDVGICLFEH